MEHLQIIDGIFFGNGGHNYRILAIKEQSHKEKALLRFIGIGGQFHSRQAVNLNSCLRDDIKTLILFNISQLSFSV